MSVWFSYDPKSKTKRSYCNRKCPTAFITVLSCCCRQECDTDVTVTLRGRQFMTFRAYSSKSLTQQEMFKSAIPMDRASQESYWCFAECSVRAHVVLQGSA